MRDYCIEMGLYFDEQGKLRRRVARDREVVRVPGTARQQTAVSARSDPPTCRYRPYASGRRE